MLSLVLSGKLGKVSEIFLYQIRIFDFSLYHMHDDY